MNPGEIPSFSDDGNLRNLEDAVKNSLSYYQRLPPKTSFFFGKKEFTVSDLIQTMESLRDFLSQSSSIAEFNRFLRQEFLIYKSSGISDQEPPAKESITFSAYHEHSLKASLIRTKEYRYPLYARPPDLVDVVSENFDSNRKGERFVGRAEGPSLVPYYTREEIDTKKILEGKGLEIAWAKDPLDILFLQIQGSGWIEIPESTQTYHIRYAGDNGRPFRSVGLYLIEQGEIPKKEFSRKRLIEYMKAQTEPKRQFILNQNPRYIFFEILSPTNTTRGALLVTLTARRSIASDPKYYPPGALAWIKTVQPVPDSEGNLTATAPLTRFVLNQDEGGAIKGPGRIDFFVGGGEEAERMAQKLWYPGELYFFVNKTSP